MNQPIEVISGTDAFETLGPVGNQGIGWYPSPKRKNHRLVPYPHVAHKAEFRMERTDKIFAIGSCFAREIEKALAKDGFRIESVDLHKAMPGSVADDFRFLRNKYTSKSIVQDLEWALEGVTDAELTTTYVQPDPEINEWVNYNFGGRDAHVKKDLASVLKAHRAHLALVERIRDCRIVIMTLGLVEAWFDTATNTYMNIAPRPQTASTHPGRFEVHVLSYEQILEDLETIHHLLSKESRVPQEILLTVSPVPLHATFRNQDVLQANVYSKSVQRAAVERFTHEKENVHYFPSYETVTLADRSDAWVEEDYRHVRPEMVQFLMERVIGRYVDTVTIPGKVLSRELVDEQDWSQLVFMYESALENSEEVPGYFRYYAGVAYWKLGMLEDARTTLQIAATEMPGHALARMYLALVAEADGDLGVANRWIDEALRAKPGHAPSEGIRERLQGASVPS